MTADQYLAYLQTVYAAFKQPFRPMPPASEQELGELSAQLGPLDAELAALWRRAAGSSVHSSQPLFQRPGFVDALDLLTPAQALALAQASRMKQRALRMWNGGGPASSVPRLTGR